MEYTKEQIEAWKAKAEKWDELDEEIGNCYGYDDDVEDDDGCDLITIGEIAAIAFGYL